MPRWIRKPEPLPLRGACLNCGDRKESRPYTFDAFLELVTEDAGQFGASLAGVRAGAKILSASEATQPGGTFVVNDEDHRRLMTALEQPHGRTWFPSFMRQLEPMIVAVESASTEEPKS